jgi:hypothetical protein
MKQNIKFFLVSLFLLLSLNLHAEEKVLCIVSNDLDSETAQMVYEMDPDQRAILHLYKDTYKSGQRTERSEIKVNELTHGGLVLNRKDKYITVRMWSDNYDQERGGVLYLDTLYSGVSGERRQYNFEIAMDKNGPVMIYNKQEFHQMRFIAKRSPILGPIGIDRVLFSR